MEPRRNFSAGSKPIDGRETGIPSSILSLKSGRWQAAATDDRSINLRWVGPTSSQPALSSSRSAVLVDADVLPVPRLGPREQYCEDISYVVLWLCSLSGIALSFL